MPRSLKLYRQQLHSFREEFGGCKNLPDVEFFMFGMGNRRKLIYKDGTLIDINSKSVFKKWEIESHLIIPNDYCVILWLRNNKCIKITENENGVYIEENKSKSLIPGTEAHLSLPAFHDNRYSEILKVLLHEVLINIVDSEPLPNLFVYNKPWRRDAAMMAMCLEKTDNTSLIRKWVLSLNEPYDYNNSGEAEADNLGQTLYLLSLFQNKSESLISKILEEAKKIEIHIPQGKYICGRSDFHEVPVYQTKWLKYGLKKLNLPDPYILPDIQDDYSSLFWWDFTENYMTGTKDAEDGEDDYYPYLGWASDHFHGLKRNAISCHDYPLTWEINASQAKYEGMGVIDTIFSGIKCSVPHTWHASEVFLYVLDSCRINY